MARPEAFCWMAMKSHFADDASEAALRRSVSERASVRSPKPTVTYTQEWRRPKRQRLRNSRCQLTAPDELCSNGDHAMDCCVLTTHALLSMSDVDRDDFIFGQLLTVSTGLSLVLIARLLAPLVLL